MYGLRRDIFVLTERERINGLPQGDPLYSVRTIFVVRLKWLVLKITIVRLCTLVGIKLLLIIYGSR